MSYQVYILYSKRLDRFYIGSTSDLDVRMQFHLAAPSGKFTGKATDWEIFMNVPCDNKQQATLIEGHIKKMKSKQYVLNLAKYPEIIEKLKRRYKG